MVKNELSKGIDIELGEEMAEGQYANMVVIAHSTSEFVLDFVRIMPGLPKARVKSIPYNPMLFIISLSDTAG